MFLRKVRYMKYAKLVTFLLFSAFLVFIRPVPAGAAKAPPGSFVRQRTDSVAQLAEHVRKDALVRQRFANHFRIPTYQVARYFEDNLRLTSLTKALRANVWYINKQNQRSVKVKLLPKGTPVYVDKTGKPILLWSCGNPMTKKIVIPPEEEKEEEEKVKAAPEEELAIEPEPEQLPKIEETPVPEKQPQTPVDDLPELVDELVPMTPPEVVTPPVDIVEPPLPEELPSAPAAGGGGPSFKELVGLTGVIPVLGTLTNSGGKHPTDGNGDGNGGNGNHNVIPEASSMIGLALGIGTLAAGRRFYRFRK